MKKRSAYPTKTTLNLMIRERKEGDLRILIPCGLVGLFLVGLFCHFAVVERLTKAYRAEQSALLAEQNLAEAQAALEPYDAVEAEYSRYFSDVLFTKDIPQECMDVLDMMEEQIMGRAQVLAYSFSGNSLLLQLKMSRFGVTSELLEALYQVPMVEQVSISTATDDLRNSLSGQESGESVVMMTITLQEVEQE